MANVPEQYAASIMAFQLGLRNIIPVDENSRLELEASFQIDQNSRLPVITIKTSYCPGTVGKLECLVLNVCIIPGHLVGNSRPLIQTSLNGGGFYVMPVDTYQKAGEIIAKEWLKLARL